MNKIHIILTGGTIDSKTIEQERDVVFDHSAIPEYLEGLKLYTDIHFTETCMKDSRDITTSDRAKIVEEIQNIECNKVIITHGTFTMVKTAKFLKDCKEIKDKVVVLTGAMIPLKFENTDAPFNLGFALSAVENLGSGVYIAMNGRIFNADGVDKDARNGRFVSIA